MIAPLDPSLSQQPQADPQPQPDVPDPAAALPADQGVDAATDAAPQPRGREETDEAWRLRFLEENAHLAPSPLVRPPAPPPMPWDGPSSSWKAPEHLSMPHPRGGSMAMALLSRTMDDLDEVTGGTRAATYDEVDQYFGHALIAEGLVPRTATPEEAIRWWKAGGYKVLGEWQAGTPRSQSVDTETSFLSTQPPDQMSGAPASVPAFWNATRTVDPNAIERFNTFAGSVANVGSRAESSQYLPAHERPITRRSDDIATSVTSGQSGEQGRPSPANPSTDFSPSVAAPLVAEPANLVIQNVQRGLSNTQVGQDVATPSEDVLASQFLPSSTKEARDAAVAAAAKGIASLPFVPRKTARVGRDLVIAASIRTNDISRLSGKNVIATSAIRSFAAANIKKFAVSRGQDEILAYGYLMPDGTVQLRLASGEGGEYSHRGAPSGPGKVIFGIHGHPPDSRMVDEISQNRDFGDTYALSKFGIPMATVYDGKIAWHELIDGQLIFSGPSSAISQDDIRQLQENLNKSQRKFLR